MLLCFKLIIAIYCLWFQIGVFSNIMSYRRRTYLWNFSHCFFHLIVLSQHHKLNSRPRIALLFYLCQKVGTRTRLLGILSLRTDGSKHKRVMCILCISFELLLNHFFHFDRNFLHLVINKNLYLEKAVTEDYPLGHILCRKLI